MVTVILARILRPADFGAYAFCILLSGILKQFTFQGIASGVAFKKNLQKSEVGVVYSTSILVGLLIYFALFLGRNFIEALPIDFDIGALTYFIGWITFCETATIVPERLMEREFSFGEIGVIRNFLIIVEGLVSVILALLGYGLMSLVLGRYLQSLLRVIIFTIRTKKFLTLSLSLNQAEKLFKFGGWVWVKQSTNYLTGNCDYFFLQLASGSYALGIYERAYRLMLLPMKRISKQIAKVTQVAFSKKHSDYDSIGRASVKLYSSTSVILFPVVFGMFVTAPEMIPFIFGPQWADSVVLFQVLSVAGILRSLIIFIETVPISIGLPKKIALPLVFHAAASIIVCWYFAKLGPVALSYAVVCIVVARSLIGLNVYKTIIGNLFDNFFKPIWPAFLSASIMLFICLMCKIWLLDGELISLELRLFFTVNIGGIVYVTAMLVLFNRESRGFLKEIGDVLGSTGSVKVLKEILTRKNPKR